MPLSLYNISKASKDIDLNLYKKKENPTLGNLDKNLSMLVLPCWAVSLYKYISQAWRQICPQSLISSTYNSQLTSYYKHGLGSMI